MHASTIMLVKQFIHHHYHFVVFVYIILCIHDSEVKGSLKNKPSPYLSVPTVLPVCAHWYLQQTKPLDLLQVS